MIVFNRLGSGCEIIIDIDPFMLPLFHLRTLIDRILFHRYKRQRRSPLEKDRMSEDVCYSGPGKCKFRSLNGDVGNL